MAPETKAYTDELLKRGLCELNEQLEQGDADLILKALKKDKRVNITSVSSVKLYLGGDVRLTDTGTAILEAGRNILIDRKNKVEALTQHC